MPEQYYLQHWGIPKMQWGIRRYRNYDGTLTEEGKERYARRAERRAEAKAKIKNYFAEKRQRKKAKKEVAKLYGGGKSVSEMTNDELNTYISRLQLEKKYNELLDKTHPDKRRAAIQFVTKMAGTLLVKAADKSVDVIGDAMFPKKSKDGKGGNGGNGGKGKKGEQYDPNRALKAERERLGILKDIRTDRAKLKEAQEEDRRARKEERIMRRAAEEQDRKVKERLRDLEKRTKEMRKVQKMYREWW